MGLSLIFFFFFKGGLSNLPYYFFRLKILFWGMSIFGGREGFKGLCKFFFPHFKGGGFFSPKPHPHRFFFFSFALVSGGEIFPKTFPGKGG